MLDGTESVLEGRGPLLQAIARAALEAGLGVVAVTRIDGSRQVQRVLADACDLAGIDTAPTQQIASRVVV